MEIPRSFLPLDLTLLLVRTRKEGPELRSTHIQRRAGTEGPSGEEKVVTRGRTAGQPWNWEPRKQSGVEAEASGPGGRSLRCAAGLVQWMRGKKVGVSSVDTSLKKIVDEDTGGRSSWRKGEASHTVTCEILQVSAEGQEVGKRGRA